VNRSVPQPQQPHGAVGNARQRRARERPARARRDPVDRDAPGPARAARRPARIDDLGYSDDGITHVGARFGYMDASNVRDVLRLVAQTDIECPLEVDEAS
jgi:hypothetical protein